MKTGTNRNDLIAGLVIMIFAAWYGFEAWTLPQNLMRPGKSFQIGPHVYPLLLAAVLFLLSLGLVIGNLRSSGGGTKAWLPSGEIVGQIIFIFIALAAYIILFQTLGYLVSTLLFMIATLKFIDRQRSLGSILFISALVSVSCYVLFVYMFKIPVPEGILM